MRKSVKRKNRILFSTIVSRTANDKFCCLKLVDLFKIVLVTDALDDYENDDDEDFGDDEED